MTTITVPRLIASEAEANAGTNDVKLMTPLKARGATYAAAEPISIRSFGGVPNAADNTQAIDDALAYMDGLGSNVTSANGASDIYRYQGIPKLYFPAGEWVYAGTGFTPVTGKAFSLVGDGPASSTIKMGADVYLIKPTDASPVMNYISLEDLKFIDGKGAYLNTKTNAGNIQSGKHVHRCIFAGYTGVAFGSLQDEDDNWTIKFSIFEGGNTGKPIGLLLPDQMAHADITGNEFRANLYDIKFVGTGRGTETIGPNNMFLNKSGYTRYAHIWFVTVPKATEAARGQGTRLLGNRFSNENSGTEPEILIAKEDIASGSDASDRIHSTSESVDEFNGFIVEDNYFQGNGTAASGNKGIILSYTGKVGPFVFRRNPITSYYPYVIEFDSSVTRTELTSPGKAIVELMDQVEGARYQPTVSNWPGLCQIWRMDGTTRGETGAATAFGGWDGNYIKISTANLVHTLTSGGSVTKTQTTDNVGGQNAAIIEYGADQNVLISLDKALVVVGEPVWVEFDIKRHTSQALDNVTLEIVSQGTTRYVHLWLTDSWRRVRIPHRFQVDPTGDATFAIRFNATGIIDVGTKDTFVLGRPVVYQANNFCNHDHLASFNSAWDRGHLLLGSSHLWIDSTGDLRVKSSAPTSDTDGTVVGTQT